MWWPCSGTLEQPKGWGRGSQPHAYLTADFRRGIAYVELQSVLQDVEFNALASSMKGEPIDLVSTSVSAQARVEAPVLDLTRSVEDQADAVTTFIDALVRLRDWWRDRGLTIVENQRPML